MEHRDGPLCPEPLGSLSRMALRELAGRRWGKAETWRQPELQQSCREDGKELLALGTSFVRQVHPWSICSLLPCIPLLSRSCFHGHGAAAATAAGSPALSHASLPQPCSWDRAGPMGQPPMAAPAHQHSASGCWHWLAHGHIHSGTNTRHVDCTTPRDGVFPCPDGSHVQCTTSHTSPRYFLHGDPFLARVWHRRDKTQKKGRCHSARQCYLHMNRLQQQTEENLC